MKLPPPPCAVLLVYIYIYHHTESSGSEGAARTLGAKGCLYFQQKMEAPKHMMAYFIHLRGELKNVIMWVSECQSYHLGMVFFHRKKMMMISCILRQSSTVNEWLPVTSRRIQMWITSSLCTTTQGRDGSNHGGLTNIDIDISTIS